MMQELKIQKEEEVRQDKIKSFVADVYKSAVLHASSTTSSSVISKIPTAPYPNANIVPSHILRAHDMSGPSDPFYIKNIKDILASLQQLFPDCFVSHSIMARAKDGKLYDVAKLDDAVLPFVDRALDQSYIVIDWS